MQYILYIELYRIIASENPPSGSGNMVCMYGYVLLILKKIISHSTQVNQTKDGFFALHFNYQFQTFI